VLFLHHPFFLVDFSGVLVGKAEVGDSSPELEETSSLSMVTESPSDLRLLPLLSLLTASSPGGTLSAMLDELADRICCGRTCCFLVVSVIVVVVVQTFVWTLDDLMGLLGTSGVLLAKFFGAGLSAKVELPPLATCGEKRCTLNGGLAGIAACGYGDAGTDFFSGADSVIGRGAIPTIDIGLWPLFFKILF